MHDGREQEPDRVLREAAVNGKSLPIILGLMITLICASFGFTLVMYFNGQEALASAVADRNERIKSLAQGQDTRWIDVIKKLDENAFRMQDFGERLRVMECAQGLPTCVPVKYKRYNP